MIRYLGAGVRSRPAARRARIRRSGSGFARRFRGTGARDAQCYRRRYDDAADQKPTERTNSHGDPTFDERNMGLNRPHAGRNVKAREFAGRNRSTA